MIFEIDTHSGIPIYKQLMNQITQGIMTGQLEPGDQLPTVRDLAGRLKVNPMTVSKAYSFLEASDLVTRQRGVGLFVADMERDKTDETKEKILEELISKAAVTAVQLGIDRETAVEQFKNLYNQFDSKERRMS